MLFQDKCPLMRPSSDDVMHGPEVGVRVEVEGVTLCSTRGLLRGVALWFASHYIFNYSYSSAYKYTLCFLQKAILNMEDETKTPISVLTIMKELNTER